jgi:hypothetical protein
LGRRGPIAYDEGLRVQARTRIEEAPVGEAVDPITVSVLQHRFVAIVEEMGEAMLRTSYSQILNSSRDFSTAICDADGRLVAQAEHVPIHVGAIPWAVRSIRQFFGDRIHRGDVYLLNDPYHGNNHLPDLTAFVPQPRGHRDLAGGDPDHPPAPLRAGRRPRRRPPDDRHQRAASPRLPG